MLSPVLFLFVLPVLILGMAGSIALFLAGAVIGTIETVEGRRASRQSAGRPIPAAEATRARAA